MTRLHGGATGPVISLQGSVTALKPEARHDGLEVTLKASNTLGVSWDAIGSAFTDVDGNFASTRQFLEGGNYLIEAEWQNSTSAEHGMKIISIGLAASADEHSVVVESNSTILNFNFNGTEKSTAFFDVVGANGSSGYSRICISKAIAPSADQLTFLSMDFPVRVFLHFRRRILDILLRVPS